MAWSVLAVCTGCVGQGAAAVGRVQARWSSVNASLGRAVGSLELWKSAGALYARDGAIRARGRSQGEVRFGDYWLGGKIVEKCPHTSRAAF